MEMYLLYGMLIGALIVAIPVVIIEIYFLLKQKYNKFKCKFNLLNEKIDKIIESEENKNA